MSLPHQFIPLEVGTEDGGVIAGGGGGGEVAAQHQAHLSIIGLPDMLLISRNSLILALASGSIIQFDSVVYCNWNEAP